MYFLIVSGMSGAGKSRAVATFEDLGYYCVDNLPIALIPRFAEICLAATARAAISSSCLIRSIPLRAWAATTASCFWIRIRRHSSAASRKRGASIR